MAVVLAVWSRIGVDALTLDLRAKRVESVEGAIAKRQDFSQGRSSGQAYYYYLDVAGRSFRVGQTGYEAAPDAGFVKLYYLPRSHHVVNLERLPDRPLPAGTTPRDVIREVGTALRSHDQVARAEAFADMAALGNAFKAQTTQPAAPPPANLRDPRPLQQAILGTWQNTVMTVTFSRDGTVTATLPIGPERHGQWSVDAAGRLLADVTGHEQAVDAWVVGDKLTISAQGEGLTFTRS